MSYDIQASGRRLEAAFPLHTEEGVADFLEKLYTLDELKYFAGDFDVSVWLVDFYEALSKSRLSTKEREVIYFLYFEGYKQSELVGLMDIKKNTINTLKKRAITKLSDYYSRVKTMEDGAASD
ncbi:sigma factor-like helix-turn-helix DNA-binding protein [Peribacillus muralis]|uniref:sigma factor-like helix-turn-helix DNA-binding protein n=1 Tax=Peribacillus muralis TaxID=264697 RepID=UPI003672CFC5